LFWTGIINFADDEGFFPSGFFGILILSAFLGTAIARFFNKRALKPMRQIIDATKQVANGDFNVQLNLEGINELEEMSDSFNKMAKELASIETLRRDFINNFSHEFKTPIVSISGFAELILEGGLSEDEKKEYLEIIVAESKRLTNLSTNVLNLSKYESTQIIVKKSLYRLDEQIRKAVVLLEPKWTKKEININLELDDTNLNGDSSLTQQIWLNLIDNAIKFSNDKGNINMSLTDSDTEIIFTIQDDGVGMSEETIRHIFDKFYQGDESHTTTGNGLGLSLVKSIVSLCEGTIQVKSELGSGSAFTVVLPK
jgi:signal transduction histidine kinase